MRHHKGSARYDSADRRLAHALGDLVELALAVDRVGAARVDTDGSCA
jgi:ArsR family transcriptional regulator, cadmium/lead-responsive transcriptional repressor